MRIEVIRNALYAVVTVIGFCEETGRRFAVGCAVGDHTIGIFYQVVMGIKHAGKLAGKVIRQDRKEAVQPHTAPNSQSAARIFVLIVQVQLLQLRVFAIAIDVAVERSIHVERNRMGRVFVEDIGISGRSRNAVVTLIPQPDVGIRLRPVYTHIERTALCKLETLANVGQFGKRIGFQLHF